MADERDCPHDNVEPGGPYEVNGVQKLADTCMDCGASLSTGKDGSGPWTVTRAAGE